MTTTNIAYAAAATITCSVASLASSSTFISGRQSSEISNTTNLYVDALVKGKITVGTTPTASTNINVYVWGSDVSLATTNLDGTNLTGTDGAANLTNTGILGQLRLGASIAVPAATSNVAYEILPFSVASLFGAMPRYWGLYVSHNTGVNLNSTAGNHAFEYIGVTYTTA